MPHWGRVNADHLTEWLYHCLAQIYSTIVNNHIYSELMWIWVTFGSYHKKCGCQFKVNKSPHFQMPTCLLQCEPQPQWIQYLLIYN
jgi:hypothetical protein